MYDRSHKVQNNERPLNKNYVEDIHYTIQLCQWFLKAIGIWPIIYNRTTKLEKVAAAFLILCCSFGLGFVLLPSGHYTLYKEKDLYNKIKLIGPIGFALSSSIKYCYLAMRGPAFGRCIEHVEKDWKILQDEDYRSIMIKNVTFGRNLTIMSALFIYSGGLSFHTVIPIFSKNPVINNITLRPLRYPGYDDLFDSQVSPTYELVFFIHCIYACITYNITISACSLAATFVTHACGQIEVQIARLSDLVEGKKNESMRGDPLALIVESHVEVLRFTKDVEEVMREILLIEIVASTIIICLIEYYCLVEWQNSDGVALMTYCVIFISFVFNILIFCYIGEILVEQGSRIGAASYDIEWYNIPEKKALGIILLLAISNYPPKLTAGRMVDLSLNTFSVVLKTTLVYFNLLRTITDW